MPRRLLLALALCAPLAVPSVAVAATRWVSPTGTAAQDCKTSATACDLVTALEGVAGNMPTKGDEVVIAAGDYTVASQIAFGTTQLDVHGAPGARPVISGPGAIFNGAGGKLHDLEIHAGGTFALLMSAAAIDHVVVRGTPGAGGMLCQCYYGSIANSLFVGGPGGTGAGIVGVLTNGGTATETLRNVTVISQTVGVPAIRLHHVGATGSVTFTAANVIAYNTAGGVDVTADDPLSQITLTHSAFATSVGNVFDGGGTVSARPLFVDAAGGDFHPAAGSPTIDAGIDDPLDGTSDLDGATRSVGTAIDIGAYEFQPPAAPPGDGGGTPPGTTPPPSGTPPSGTPSTGEQKTPPRLDVRVKAVVLDRRHGRGMLAVRCRAKADDHCAVRGKITARVRDAHGKRHTRTLATVAGTLAGGHGGKLRVALTAVGRRLLAPGHTLKATLTASVRGAGGKTSVRKPLKLRRARR